MGLADVPHPVRVLHPLDAEDVPEEGVEVLVHVAGVGRLRRIGGRQGIHLVEGE